MTEEVRSILKEFHGNRVAMAGEIARLRGRLDDARFEISRLAASTHASAVVYPMAAAPVRPVPSLGFR